MAEKMTINEIPKVYYETRDIPTSWVYIWTDIGKYMYKTKQSYILKMVEQKLFFLLDFETIFTHAIFEALCVYVYLLTMLQHETTIQEQRHLTMMQNNWCNKEKHQDKGLQSPCQIKYDHVSGTGYGR